VSSHHADKPLRSLPNLWPILEVIVYHPIWTILIFLGLLLLTGLFWFGSHKHNATTQRALSELDRVYMLRRLRLRYEQMLSQSLQGTIQVELGLVSRPAAVQNAVSLSLRLPDQSEQPLPPYTAIREMYELAQQELLILVEPGAGKSTLLLELAHQVVCQAERDITQPLPVLLPLSSWAASRRPLSDWLCEQATLLYDVPRNLSRQWNQAELVLPLLDGLD
jgi:predicted NACHT family NTPase